MPKADALRSLSSRLSGGEVTLAALLACVGCGGARGDGVVIAEPPPTSRTLSSTSRSAAPAPIPSASQQLTPDAAAQLEPDGNDEESATALVPARGHFEKVGRHWASLTRVCDFAVLGSALYSAHATRPLGLGGASITRYEPQAKPPFTLAFDWNRPGEPEKGGGAGQGFLRLRLIDGRLYAPDADPPYLGLGTAAPIEGYMFSSDQGGVFPASRRPGHLPPRAPSLERGGASALPGAVHGFDVIRFRERIYASTSAMIPPNGGATSSPGALLTPEGDPRRPWHVAFTYAGAPGEASVRLGYMVRFRDRLYVSVSPLYGLDDHDALVLDPLPSDEGLSKPHVTLLRVSQEGGAHTLRWYADRGNLYWIGVSRGGATLRMSEDGLKFRRLALPGGTGAPTDILRVGEQLLVLTENALFELQEEKFLLRAPAPSSGVFRLDDSYCAAPLVAYQGHVYAGDQERGALWRLVSD